MASRKTKETRFHSKPYARATASSASSQPISGIVASTSSNVPPSGKPGTTLRDGFIKTCQRYHPNIKPRDDWELFLLGSIEPEEYGTTNEEFYAYADNYDDFDSCTGEKIKDGRARAKRIQECTETLDTPGYPTGLKPAPGDDDVHVCPIPNSEYSIRIWGTNLELNHEYCLDFVETATGKPVNSPFKKYELWAVPNKRTPWLPSPSQRLSSLERGFGVKEKDVKPGEEKFLLMEGSACILKRPGMRTVYFEAPVRPRAPVDLAELSNFDELDFGFSSMKRCGFCQCCKSIACDSS